MSDPFSSKNQSSFITHFLQGGHGFRHRLRLLRSMLSWVFLISVLISGVVFVVCYYGQTIPYQRYVVQQALWAQLLTFFEGPSAKLNFITASGQSLHLTVNDLLHSALWQQTSLVIKTVLWQGATISLSSTALIMSLLIVGLSWRGRRGSQPKTLRGDTLVSVKKLKRQLKRDKCADDITLGKAKLPLVKNSACQHLLIDGTTGVGKSTVIRELLDHIRGQGDRALIWDEGGQLLSQYYQPEQDNLLNPLDARSQSWDVWSEGHQKADFEQMAAALIPISGSQDPFWVLGARTLFSEVAYAMRDEADKSTAHLLKRLLQSDLGELSRYLADSIAANLVAEKMAKTTLSLQSVLATYVKGLRYLEASEKPFSLKQWVSEENNSGWLFITALDQQLPALKPLITLWLDMAFSHLLSLPANPERRLWIILDEVASLQAIPSLTQLLAKSRKVGGCVVIGTQNRAQLASLYGQHGSEVISSLLNTRLFFRQPDPTLATWSAKNAGVHEVQSLRESMSVGNQKYRNGLSLHQTEQQKPLLLPSDIMALPDLQCYVRLPGGYPLTQMDFVYQNKEKQSDSFVSKDKEQDMNTHLVDKNIQDTVMNQDSESDSLVFQLEECI